MRLVGWCAVALGLASAAVGRAAGETFSQASVRVARSASASACLDRRGVAALVEDRLGRPVFVDHTDPDLRLRIAFDRADGGWVARLELESRGGRKLGTRELAVEAAHCSALDDSVALALALMLDVPREEVVEGDREARKQAGPSAPVRTAPASTPLRLPRDTLARREPWGWEAGALGVVGAGLMPGVALGGRITVAARPPRLWTFELDGTWWPGRQTADDDAGARLEQGSVGLFACPLEASSVVLRGRVCVGQELGWVRAEGYGFDEIARPTRPTYSAVVRGRGWWTLAGPLAVGAGLGVGVPVVRDRFVYSEPDGTRRELFRPAPVGLVGELGLELALD